MIRFRQSIILYCLVSLALLLVVYKQLPVDDQGKSNTVVLVPNHKQRPRDAQKKQISYYTNRYFGKIAGNFFKISNISQPDFEREVHNKIQSIEKRLTNNEMLLEDIKSILKEVKLTHNDGHQVNEIEQHIPNTKAVVASENNYDNDALNKLHKRVYNKMTTHEIDEFYKREEISVSKYKSHVLHPIKDRQLLMGLFPGPDETRDRVTDQLYTKLDLTASRHKTIFVSGSRVNTQLKFDKDKCNVDKCTITSDPKQASTADAVYTEMRIDNKYLNSNKNPNQVTVVFQLESARNYPSLMTGQMPPQVSNKHTTARRTLNWTASYRTDSVLNTPYERFTPFLNVTGLPVKPAENYARGKTKMATWFVSNCNAASGRNNYVKELQKYMTVDIYGRCGKSCPKTNKKCFEQLNTDYRFYLAFENSNCKDYLTEKVFWNALS